jgi:hypothetical protein
MWKVRNAAWMAVVFAGLGLSAYAASQPLALAAWPVLWSQVLASLDQAPTSARAWALLPAGLLGLGFIGRNQHSR